MSKRQIIVPLHGDRLRKLRERRGLSQRELSRRCDLGETAVYRFENSIVEPAADTVARLARELRVSMDYLMGLSDKETGQLSENALTPEEQLYVDLNRSGGFEAVSAYVLNRLTEQLRKRGDIT